MVATVHIIESPSPDDFLSDRREGPTLAAALKHAGIAAVVYTPVTKDSFTSVVELIAEHHSVQVEPEEVIVHLSAHGNDKGVGLTSKEMLGWPDLRGYLSYLNVVADGGLLVVMSTCEGYKGVKMAHDKEPAPFRHLVGSDKKFPWSDTVAAFVPFYHLVAKKGRKPEDGVEVINAILGARTFDCADGNVQREAFLYWLDKREEFLRKRFEEAVKKMQLAAQPKERREKLESLLREIREGK
jgi:hypothetical protein